MQWKTARVYRPSSWSNVCLFLSKWQHLPVTSFLLPSPGKPKKSVLALKFALEIHTIFGCYRAVYRASFTEKFTIACSEVLMGSKKETPNLSLLVSACLFQPARHRMILSECFMLAVVNFAWRNARVLHHFIPTNEASNEKYIFSVRLSSIAIAGPKRMNFLLFLSPAKCLLSTNFFALNVEKSELNLFARALEKCWM